MNLAQNIEGDLDKEREKQTQGNKNKHEKLKGSIQDITGELELNGRRLIIMEALSKDKAGVRKTQEEKDKYKDKRNVSVKH